MHKLSSAGLLRIYLEMNLLILFAFFTLSLSMRILGKLRATYSYSHFIKIGYFSLFCSLFFPILLFGLPKSNFIQNSNQVWSSGIGTSSYTPLYHSNTLNESPSFSGFFLFDKIVATNILIGILLFSLLILLLSFLRKYHLFHKHLQTLPLIRKVGRVTLLASDECSVAFSTWTPYQAIVVIPNDVIAHPVDFKLTVIHEIQHHRNGDTQWIFFIELLKIVFFWNPGIYGFSRQITQLQEFACDEYLIGRRKLSSQAYGGCLARAAESAIGLQPLQIGAIRMAAINDPSLLKRRIKMILNYQPKRPAFVSSFLISTGIFLLMSSVGYTASSSFQEKTLSLEEAKQYAAKISQIDIPITVNDLVLKKLNHLIGTPEGRQWVKEGFARMPQYQEMIFRKFSSYEKIHSFKLPQELIAIPLYESGFKNLPPTPPQKGAGIWEFISETARHYDLEVSDQKDERLNPERETDAAMAYLHHLFKKFKDWRLAIKAYNEGEVHVQELIDQNHTHDPWKLERIQSAEGYLSGVMAMMIIMKTPELLE